MGLIGMQEANLPEDLPVALPERSTSHQTIISDTQLDSGAPQEGIPRDHTSTFVRASSSTAQQTSPQRVAKRARPLDDSEGNLETRNYYLQGYLVLVKRAFQSIYLRLHHFGQEETHSLAKERTIKCPMLNRPTNMKISKMSPAASLAKVGPKPSFDIRKNDRQGIFSSILSVRSYNARTECLKDQVQEARGTIGDLELRLMLLRIL